MSIHYLWAIQRLWASVCNESLTWMLLSSRGDQMSWTPPEMFKVNDQVFLRLLRIPCLWHAACWIKSSRRGQLFLWYPPSVYLLLIPLFGHHIGRQSLSPILLLSWFKYCFTYLRGWQQLFMGMLFLHWTQRWKRSWSWKLLCCMGDGHVATSSDQCVEWCQKHKQSAPIQPLLWNF